MEKVTVSTITRVLLKHSAALRLSAEERVKEAAFCNERALSITGGSARKKWLASHEEALEQAERLFAEAENMEAVIDALHLASVDRLVRIAEDMEDIASDEPSFPQAHADMAQEAALTIRAILKAINR